jgi:hypothetical protein
MEGRHGAGSGLVQVVGLEKLVNGLSVGSRWRPAIGSDPPQDMAFHRELSGCKCKAVARRAPSMRLRADTSCRTTVENVNGVSGPAKAKPPCMHPLVHFSMAKISFSRWRPHLGNTHREQVTLHVVKDGDEQELLLLGELPALL